MAEYTLSKMSETDDLQKINNKISAVENESLASTRRMMELISNSKTVGTATAQELVIQGEKLINIEKNLDNINQDLKETKKNISNLKGFFSRLKNRFTRSKVTNKRGLKPVNSNVANYVATMPILSAPASHSHFEQVKISGSDREAEINSDLNTISFGINELKSLALGMQSEMDRQKPIVDGLIMKIDKTDQEIEAQNHDLKRIK